MLHQGVEQSVHAWQHVERALFESFNELGKVARIGHQGEVRALTHGQEAQRQREDVIQRQRRDAVDIADTADTLCGRCKPRFGLQNACNHIAMCEHSTL